MSKNKGDRINYNQELEEQYHVQRKKIFQYCEKFDNGDLDYASDIANGLYILSSENGQVSILQQLGIKSKIWMYSKINKKGRILSGSPLVSFKITQLEDTSEIEIVNLSKIDSGRLLSTKKLSFTKWWSQYVVFVSHASISETLNENLLRRSDIIEYVRNQEAGGHFDKLISEKLLRIKENFVGVTTGDNNQGISFPIRLGPELNKVKNKIVNFNDYPSYVIRYIAHEFLVSTEEINIDSARKFLNLK